MPRTPAGILLTVPGIGVVTASYYGAALGDPSRFRNAGAAYRYAGLAPTSYESAGRRATGVHISKIGSVELRQAILTLGTGLALHHPDFAAYKQRLRSAGKKPLVAAIAVGHRAQRLAFALVRSQQPYNPSRWATSVARAQPAGRPVMAAEATNTTKPARPRILPSDHGRDSSEQEPEDRGGRGRNNVDKYQQPPETAYPA